MKNVNKAEISCSDSEKFTEIIENLSIKDAIIDSDPLRDFEFIIVHSNDDSPYEEIISLSKQYPDLTFTTCYQFGADDLNNCYYFNFKNGVVKEPETKMEYHINVDVVNDNYKGEIGAHFFRLFKKAMEYFRRIDCLRITENGRISLDFAEEVRVVIEEEGYSMTVTKDDCEIRVSCFDTRVPEKAA